MSSPSTHESPGQRAGYHRAGFESNGTLTDSNGRFNQEITILDYYENAKDWKAQHTVTVKNFLEGIRSIGYLPKVLQLRKLLAEGRKEEADIFKKTLPAVSISGTVEGRRKNAAKAGRFLHSGLLQIDLDGKDNPDFTVAELKAALADNPHVLAAFVSASGTGAKGVARIPADASTHKAAFLAAEAHFASLGLKIDTSTKDPVRLCFASYDPAIHINGEATELHVEPMEEIEIDPAPRKEKSGLVIAGDGRHEATLADLAEMIRVIPRPAYDEWLKLCSGAWNHFGESATTILQAQWPEEQAGEYAEKFAHRLADITLGSLFYVAQGYGYRPPVRVRATCLRITPERAEEVAKEIDSGRYLRAMEEGDRGLAQAYADLRFTARCYSHDECSWRHYEDGVWKRDTTGSTMNDLQETLTPLLTQSAEKKCAKLTDEKDKNEVIRLRKRALCLLGIRTAKLCLENAQVLTEFSANRGDFDQDHDLLAIENGTIDFKTGTVRPHSPGDMLTVSAPLFYDPGAKCPTFDRFLAEVTCGDVDLENFLLEFVAYCMTGHTHFDFLLFLYGLGANGKGTFTQTIERLLGKFLCLMLDNGLLVGQRESSTDDYKRASLEGIRLAIVDELPDGRNLRTEGLKKLIGGDSIQARNPYERMRTFRPTHKLMLAGNHKPGVSSTDNGTWRRILLVPWNAKFSGDGMNREERVSRHLAEKAGILNRLLAAWARVKANGGLNIPAAVKAASEEYKLASDQIAQFAEERLTEWPGGAVPLTGIRTAYQAWCIANGEKPVALSAQKFGIELKRIGYTTRKGGGKITMLEDAMLSQEAEE